MIRWSFYYTGDWEIPAARGCTNVKNYAVDYLLDIDRQDNCIIRDTMYYDVPDGTKCDICYDHWSNLIKLPAIRTRPPYKKIQCLLVVCARCLNNNIYGRIGAILGAFARLREDLIDDVVLYIFQFVCYED